MQKIFYLTTIVALFVAACHKNKDTNDIQSDLNGRWKMVAVTDNTSGVTETKPTSISGDVELQLVATSTTVGKVDGKTAINAISNGSFTYNANTKTFTMGNFAMTQINENTWGNLFLNNIISATAYSLLTQNKLRIVTENKVIVFDKM